MTMEKENFETIARRGFTRTSEQTYFQQQKQRLIGVNWDEG